MHFIIGFLIIGTEILRRIAASLASLLINIEEGIFLGRKIAVGFLTFLLLISSLAVVIGEFSIGTASADFHDGDYLYLISGGNATITRYAGTGGVISIPSTLGGYNVVAIGGGAFAYCPVTSVTIPDSVVSIGDYAFYMCSALTSVTIGKGVTSIGASAFNTCGALTSMTIPDSVISIGDYAFYQCFNLTSVTIGSGVTSIGYYTFARTDLTSVTFIGNAPTLGNPWVTGYNGNPWATGHNSNLRFYYLQQANGFTTPTWNNVSCYLLTSAPLVPTGLNATPGDGYVSLSWTIPSSIDNGSIDYYIVYQNGVDVSHPTTTSTTITGLTNGHSYTFAVVGHNPLGVSAQSSSQTISPKAESSSPGATTSLGIDDMVYLIGAAILAVIGIIFLVNKKRKK